MKKNDTQKIDKLNTMLDVNYNESKEEIWLAMQSKLKEPTKVIPLKQKSTTTVWAIAASILVLLGFTSFFRFYTQSFETQKGMIQTVELPDGSIAKLNGASSLKFYPFWWKVSRNISFEGEAFFEVAKGSKFAVHSSKGTTTVLGTSFNVYARESNYEVLCVTGKVWVQNQAGNISAIITPNQKAVLGQHQFDVSENISKTSIGWLDNKFYFTTENINRVFNEVAIAYGVEISFDLNEELKYSGNFSRNEPIEDVLNLICKSLNLKFVNDKPRSFIIARN